MPVVAVSSSLPVSSVLAWHLPLLSILWLNGLHSLLHHFSPLSNWRPNLRMVSFCPPSVFTHNPLFPQFYLVASLNSFIPSFFLLGFIFLDVCVCIATVLCITFKILQIPFDCSSKQLDFCVLKWFEQFFWGVFKSLKNIYIYSLQVWTYYGVISVRTSVNSSCPSHNFESTQNNLMRLDTCFNHR